MEQILKKWLKKIRLSEPVISTFLGGLVIMVVGLLIFNYFKTAQSPEIAVQEPKEEQGKVEFEKASSQGKAATHQVEKGESLWEISEKHYQSGYNWVDIAKANNLSNPDHLEAGQELKLPQIEAKQPTIQQAEVEKNQTVDDSITEKSYKVEKNDSLWKIAVRAYGDGYQWPKIAQANNLSNPDLIETGQELRLPR